MPRPRPALRNVLDAAWIASVCALLVACGAAPQTSGDGTGVPNNGVDGAVDGNAGLDGASGDGLVGDDGQRDDGQGDDGQGDDGAGSADSAPFEDAAEDATNGDVVDEDSKPVDGDPGDGDPGDGVDDGDADEPKLQPEAPVVFIVEDPPVTANVATLAKGAWTEAVAVDPAVVLVQAPAKGSTPAAVALLGPVEGQVTPLTAELGALVAAMSRQSVVLVWHAAGVSAQVQAKLLPSPLAAALGAPVQQWRRGAGDDLWLLAGGKLWLWRVGKLATVSWPADAPGATVPTQGSSDATDLAFGCLGLAGPSLALSGPHGLRVVHVAAGGAVQSASWIEGRAVGSLVCDAAGVLWAETQGELVSRGVAGNWTTWSFGLVAKDPTVAALGGQDGLGGFWIDVAGVRWRQELGVWRRVLGVPDAAAWSDDPKGGIVGVAGGAVVRVQTVAPTPKPPVSWVKDIKPIYEASCALCHGPEGVATKLDTDKKWKDKIEIVLQYVEAAAMPLPPKQPLGSNERALIAKWKSDGFQP